MKILVLDNYDSFTFNLVQYIERILGQPVDVFRNDQIALEEIEKYDAIVLSPGPGLPSEAGIMPELIKRYAPKKAILGVCLGHQAIGEAFGGQLENLSQVYHGIETAVDVVDAEEPLFAGVPQSFQAGRYHSWVVKKEDLPESLVVTAVDGQGMIMAFRHKEYNVRGVQFHPESIMTEWGMRMLENFLSPLNPSPLGPPKGEVKGDFAERDVRVGQPVWQGLERG
jgi:anthranilate synthase component 2